MKQKIVIKVHMRCDKCRKKALCIVASTHGVESMGVKGDERDQLVVVGDGVDATSLTSCLRRKVGHAEIVKVEAVGAEEETKPAADEAAASAVATHPPQQWHQGYHCSPQYCHDDSHSHMEPWCTIL